MKNSIPECLPLGMLSVARGLYLRTYENGKTFWYARNRDGGRDISKKLASYPETSIELAKALAEKYNAGIVKNTIPTFITKASFDLELEDVILESGPRPMCGVYMLIDGANVVYVGQSINMLSRLGKHAYDKNFTHYKVLECNKDELDALEAHYINKFKPKYNRVREDGSIVTNLPYKTKMGSRSGRRNKKASTIQ